MRTGGMHRVGTIALGLLVTPAAGCGESAAVTTAPPDPPTTLVVTTTVPTLPATTTTVVEAIVLEVPTGAAPVLDGSFTEDAWAGALLTPVDDDLTLLWLHEGDSLFLGARHSRRGAVNLWVADGDRVRALHSSGALGSASYHLRADGTWRLEHGFDWCCRSSGDTDSLDALWAAEGWAASIGTIGTAGEVEFGVDIVAETRVALSWVGPTGDAVTWPADLPDTEAASLHGMPADTGFFTPELWPLLRFQG